MVAAERQPLRTIERLSNGPQLEAILDEFSNRIHGALTQASGLLDDSGGNTFHARHRRGGATTSRPPARFTHSFAHGSFCAGLPTRRASTGLTHSTAYARLPARSLACTAPR